MKTVKDEHVITTEVEKEAIANEEMQTNVSTKSSDKAKNEDNVSKKETVGSEVNSETEGNNLKQSDISNGAEKSESKDEESNKKVTPFSESVRNDIKNMLRNNSTYSIVYSAYYEKKILTGKFSGYYLDHKQNDYICIISYSPYKDATSNNEIYSSINIIVPASNMNLPFYSKEQALSSRVNRNITEHKIQSMLGATVDVFVTGIDYDEDRGKINVYGDRKEAMDHKQNRIKNNLNALKGKMISARILRTLYKSMDIEIYGYTTKLPVNRISRKYVNIQENYHPGDDIIIRVNDIYTDNNGNVTGFDIITKDYFYNNDIDRNNLPLPRSVVAAKVQKIDRVKGVVHLILPNDYRGIAYISKEFLSYRKNSIISVRILKNKTNPIRCAIIPNNN